MILHLWRDRCRGKTAAESMRLLLRRLWTLPELLVLLIRRSYLKTLGASIGENTVLSRLILRGRVSRLFIGKNSIVGRAEFLLLDQICIGDEVVVNDGALLLTGTHDVTSPDYIRLSKAIRIDDYAWIASRAIILPGVHVGRGSVVAAGAVVTKDVEPGCVVAGNPAKVVHQRRPSDLRYMPYRGSAAVEAWLGDCFAAENYNQASVN